MTKPIPAYQLKRDAWIVALKTQGHRRCVKAFCDWDSIRDISHMWPKERKLRHYRVCALALLAEVLGHDPIAVFYEPQTHVPVDCLADELQVPRNLLTNVMDNSDKYNWDFDRVADYMTGWFKLVDEGVLVPTDRD